MCYQSKTDKNTKTFRWCVLYQSQRERKINLAKKCQSTWKDAENEQKKHIMCIAVQRIATVNMLYTCTAGSREEKNERPNDDDDDGDGFLFFLLSTLSAIDMHSVSWTINNIFIFILDNDDIFICVSFSLLIFEHAPHNIISYIHFWLLLFFITFAFYLSLKTNCHSTFSIGWSVLHWLKQCQCAYTAYHTLNHTTLVKRESMMMLFVMYRNAEI